MRGRKKKKEKPTSDNPEVQAAMDERDELIAGMEAAVENVDRLNDELMEEYREANGVKE